MAALTIAGKMAPKPSEPSTWAISHSSAFSRARRRHRGTGPTTSTSLIRPLTPANTADQNDS